MKNLKKSFILLETLIHCLVINAILNGTKAKKQVFALL